MTAPRTKLRKPETAFYRPFQRLREQLGRLDGMLITKPCPPRCAPEPDEAALFHTAMQEVVPLQSQGAFSVPWQPRPSPPLTPAHDEWEVLCQLNELVAGRGSFDLSLTDEYVEGHVPHLDPQVMAALKAGTLPIQDYCDLHGLSVALAQVRLREFLRYAQSRGYRTVLVVHGRGHNSPGHLPVLKQHLAGWLTMKRFRRQVLAFASAQPYDGGTGALYLLLRRKQPALSKQR
ncbi:MAG: Smr/MutS family protein [Desulfobacca sp.]|uniref:Smr/MutS family protein n=1 Tax=Desulfobacca sp. TaxID=2067990 RepID=UPI00404A6FC0